MMYYTAIHPRFPILNSDTDLLVYLAFMLTGGDGASCLCKECLCQGIVPLCVGFSFNVLLDSTPNILSLN